MDWGIAIALLAWLGSGVIGGQMLSYPGDGVNMRHFLGAMVGPIALGIALAESRP